MKTEEFTRICEWDAKITWPENTMFGTSIDRRRLIEYVKELHIERDQDAAEIKSWQEDLADAEWRAKNALEDNTRLRDLLGSRKSRIAVLEMELRNVKGDLAPYMTLSTAQYPGPPISIIEGIELILAAAPTRGFQTRVLDWLLECFGGQIASDVTERNHRFLEEALEVVQSLGCTHSEASQLVDYVFGRPSGDVTQEIGGAVVTLAALCTAVQRNMEICGEQELARIWVNMLQIRAKQAAKPKHSPLPNHAPDGQVLSGCAVRAVIQMEKKDG